jgi:membrane protease YdiL (CAAX protease family)
MIALQHILAVFLFLGVPIWDALETRTLKRSANPRRKILSYRRIVVIEWIAAITAWVALRSQIFFPWPAAYRTDLPKGGTSFVMGFVLAAAFALSLQTFLTRRNRKLKDATLKALSKLAFVLPDSHEERSWFAVVSITAGVCEEILYRGFLPRYLSAGPWHFNIWVALAVSSIVFGLAHGYQGIKGIFGTAILGAVLMIIFFAAGNLWLPIAIHALIDLRVLLLLRTGDLSTARA